MKKIPYLKSKDAKIFIYVLASVFLRYLMCGFKYFYQLDDYIQYYAYPMRGNPWEVVAEQGLLSSRPLAGLGDLFVWGHFFEFMLSAVFIISILYSCSAVLFLKVFRKHFKTGFMFVMFYAVSPFLFEGTYWISASTRIVVGLFFTSAAVYGLQRFFERSKKQYILLFWVMHLLSLCFYEQIFILSCVLSFFIVILNFNKEKKRLFPICIILLNACAYFVITAVFKNSSSALGNRLSLVIPSLSPWYLGVMRDLLDQLKSAFITVPAKITFVGFIDGLKHIFKDGILVALPAAGFLGWGAFALGKREYTQKNEVAAVTVVSAVLLAVLPIALFFFIPNPYVSLRNILPSYVGIALVLDLIWGVFARRNRLVMKVCSVLVAVVFFVSSVSELYTYKTVYEFDHAAGRAIETVMKENGYKYKSGFIIEREDIGEIPVLFHEHGYGVTSSGWALCGLLNYYNLENKQNNVKADPIETADGIYCQSWEAEAKNLLSFEKLYYWQDGGFTEVFADVKSDSETDLVTAGGEIVAHTHMAEGVGYIDFVR